MDTRLADPNWQDNSIHRSHEVVVPAAKLKRQFDESKNYQVTPWTLNTYSKSTIQETHLSPARFVDEIKSLSSLETCWIRLLSRSQSTLLGVAGKQSYLERFFDITLALPLEGGKEFTKACFSQIFEKHLDQPNFKRLCTNVFDTISANFRRRYQLILKLKLAIAGCEHERNRLPIVATKIGDSSGRSTLWELPSTGDNTIRRQSADLFHYLSSFCNVPLCVDLRRVRVCVTRNDLSRVEPELLSDFRSCRMTQLIRCPVVFLFPPLQCFAFGSLWWRISLSARPVDGLAVVQALEGLSALSQKAKLRFVAKKERSQDRLSLRADDDDARMIVMFRLV